MGDYPSYDSGPAYPEEQRGNGSNRRWLLALVGIVLVIGLVVGGAFALGGGDDPQPAADTGPQTSTTQETTQSEAPPPPPPGQPPGTIRLPEGGTAKLVRRELTSDGTLPIPDGLDEATWWGAGLGAPKGASLLSGHVNWKGKKGPFDELWRQKVGQRVEVVDAKGAKWVYKVSEIVTVDKHELPAKAEKLFGQNGPHRLVLVTCGGEYVGGTDGYKDNRIIVAELISRPV
ncbi:sortase family protein [Herbihabitans rhizosphaerae]|uniref:Sortase family protein n=1 Tax=Herbihabitans rhizosphaerae TaxID=1872711 RepID=A0A4Q7KEJ0_9PSEU|nr:class F sortase [Herbihabitans rhizosphaerae]RZS29640.1 sortase family protein [Herbihabitans rhizosphaerae]